MEPEPADGLLQFQKGLVGQLGLRFWYQENQQTWRHRAATWLVPRNMEEE